MSPTTTLLGPSLLAVVALLSLRGAPAPPEASEFVALDPATIRVTLVAAELVTRQAEGSLATLRVECPQGHAGGVEPLAFRVTPKAKGAVPVVVRRVDDPAYGRMGRAAFPGAPCDVPLVLPLDPKATKGATVEVLEVSAWLGPATQGDEEPPVEVGRPSVDTGFDAERGQSVPRTTIPLTNRLAHDVDVVLRAEFVNPRAGTTLVHGRVPAKRSTDLVVAAMPVGRGEFIGAEIRRVELVDWSVLVDDGAALAREKFTEAWERWYSVPSERLPLTARFHFTRVAAKTPFEARGEVEFDRGGKVNVRLEGTQDDARLRELRERMAAVAAHVSRREAAAALGEAPELTTTAPTLVVRLAQHPLPDELRLPHFVEVVDRALRRIWVDDRRDGLLEELEVVDDGAAWRVVSRRDQTATAPTDATIREEVRWLRLDGLWLPGRLTQVMPDWAPGFGYAVTIQLDSWRQGATAMQAPDAPTGPLADELRAAWDAIHRHPSAAVRVECAFAATNPGTSGVWLGRKKASGSFALSRFVGAAWGDADATIDEAKSTPDERERLGMAALDRLSIWSNRDLCREPRFEEAFRGARLARDGEWITIEGAPYLGAKVVDGTLAALRLSTGDVATFRWKRVDGALVPVELRRRDERITLTWTALPDGWLWPTRCEFVDVLLDFGTEVLEMSKVRVTALE